MEKLFSNQTVLISGGLGDIGQATALAFADRGAAVALCDIHPEADAQDFLTRMKLLKVPCGYSRVDVTSAASVHSWIDKTERTMGTAGIIIANAAIATLAGIHQISPEQWERELNVNLNGSFYMTAYGTARLQQQGLPGRVVFVSSWAGTRVHQHMPAYSVSKAAIGMLCKCMALELAPHRILVNEIALGYVDAGLSGRIWKDHPGLLEEALRKVPVKKVMSAETVAEQILYLCDPRHEHITGASLLMDGGLSLL